jgi:hypothetical protein
MSDNPIVKTIVHAHALRDLPMKTPVRLTWELPQLFQHIVGMGDNSSMTHATLVKKCVALVMATTCARFTEIQQFSSVDTEPETDNSKWAFIVRIKNRKYVQPIILHHMLNALIDPVKAMRELRDRVLRLKRKYEMRSDTFWCDVKGNVMRIDEIRTAAQQLLTDAGIKDRRAYHIKHATISWLHKQGVPADQIIRFIRHALGSTTYMEYYLSEDLGAKCTGILESTALLGDQRKDGDDPHEKEETSQQGGAWESSPLEAIAASINAAATAPYIAAQTQKKKSRFLRSPRN